MRTTRKLMGILATLCLSLGVMATVTATAASAKTQWDVTGTCTLQPVSVTNNATTARCTVTPSNTVVQQAVSDIANNEYGRTVGCTKKSTCAPEFDGPWTVGVDISATSVMVQMTGLPKEGKWDATYSGPAVFPYATSPQPSSSYAAFDQWQSDLEGVYDLVNGGVVGAAPNDYLITTSGKGHLTTVIVSRPT